MKSGLTLLEVLLALALLASLVVATMSWTTMAARFGTQLERALEQEASIEAFLRLMHDCIATRDFASDGEDDDRPHVFIDEADGALVVRGRALGEVVVLRFKHDAEAQELLINDRAILDHVVTAGWSIDDDHGVLTITIALKDGMTASRRYVLP